MRSSGQRLAAAVVLATLLVVAAVVVSQSGTDGGPAEPVAPTDLVDAFAGIDQDGLRLGEPGAEVAVAEFIDMQCPFCAEFATDALPEVIDKYVRNGSIALELEVLAFLGPDSEETARLVAAASLQDHAWETAELLFARQGAENSGYADEDFLSAVAVDVPGLDAERALADRDSPKVDAILAAATERAAALGVDSTPAFVATPRGGQPQQLELSSLDLDEFMEEIEPLLVRAGK